MKLLCLAIVVCLVFSAEAGPWVYNTNPMIKSAFQSLKRFFSFVTENASEKAMVHPHRLRRQSQQRCFRDIQETNGERFRDCNALLQTFFNGENVTANATMQFCGRAHCPDYLIFLSERLVQDCNFPDTLDPNMKTFINQSCDEGPDHTPCISVWNMLGHLDNTSTEAVTYGKCLQEYQANDRICNADCKMTENWITVHVGCCYRAMADYYKSIGVGSDGLLTDDNWDLCNVKEPDLCMSRPPPVTRGPPFTRGPPVTGRPPFTRGPPVTRGPPHADKDT